MIRGELRMNGQATLQAVFDAAWEGIERAVVYYNNTLVNVVGTSAGPSYVRRKRNTAGGKKGSQRTVYLNPSKPGEPPHKRTGAGQSSIGYELDKAGMRGRVGIQVFGKHMGFLELAREYNRRRPWFLATLNKIMARLEVLAGGSR